ncbi:MAG TPA: glutamine synthetase, partial [Rhizobiales bacterium]|nr:glutamine synthetase [Hyphomicrobiales bacterium]
MVGSTGRAGFADKAGINDADRQKKVIDVLAQIKDAGLETIRLSFADQHGVLRGKTLVIGEAESALRNGCTMTSSLLAKDTSHKTVFPMWEKGGGLGMSQMQGAGDFIMLPDPETFRILPWAGKTGWLLCDIYFCDGVPVPFSTRKLLQDATGELASRNMKLICGLEVEFYVFKREDAMLSPADAGGIGFPATAPAVSLLAHGYQYLTEQRIDELEPVSEMLRQTCMALGLPLRSMENEFGPSQFEFTFQPTDALTAADNMMLFRSAVKQVCQRQGLHATFMCKPQVKNTFSSGWHLHQSLVDTKSGK